MRGEIMIGFAVEFTKMPTIGAAMHFYSDNYHQHFCDPGLEIVYVKRSGICLRLYGREYIAPTGSVLTLPRSLPFEVYSKDGEAQSHATVWLLSDFSFKLLTIDERTYRERDALILPFITPPSRDNERIMKRLYAIIASIDEPCENARLAVSALAILDELSRRARTEFSGSTASILEYKIKRYLLAHLDENITLSDLAREFSKSPNYLNSVFTKQSGVSIHQFIIRERLAVLCDMLTQNVAFADACARVGISDVNYAYRLFKRHIGLTPGEFIESKSY